MNNEVKHVYGYYSKLLNMPFDTFEELVEAEEAHLEKEKAKEIAAAQKEADFTKVDKAFKQLCAARTDYVKNIKSLTQTYHNNLQELKKSFKEQRAAIEDSLVTAEEAYAEAVKEFDKKYSDLDYNYKTNLVKLSEGLESNDKIANLISDAASTIIDILYN